jgi:hypothetical protein
MSKNTQAIMGIKIGMSQIFDNDGKAIPVTVVEAGPCRVIQKKTRKNDGYEAIQVGFGDIKENRVNKPIKGHFQKANLKPLRHIKEILVENADDYEIGQEIKADIFEVGNKVDFLISFFLPFLTNWFMVGMLAPPSQGVITKLLLLLPILHRSHKLLPIFSCFQPLENQLHALCTWP